MTAQPRPCISNGPRPRARREGAADTRRGSTGLRAMAFISLDRRRPDMHAGSFQPRNLSERAIESNVLRRLAHCLEECCGMKRDDILFHLPTQREEKKLAYDSMVVGVWVALQFKRAACVRKDGAARFSIDLEQARQLEGLLPPGGAFYALAPIAELDPFIASLPEILDMSCLVDVHHLARQRLGKGTISLWITKAGDALVRDGGSMSSLGRPLKISSLCCPKKKSGARIGFSVGAGGKIFYRAGPSHDGMAALEPWPGRVDDVAVQLRNAPVLRLPSRHWDRR